VTDVVESSVPEVLIDATVGITIIRESDITVVDTAAVVTVVDTETAATITDDSPASTVITDSTVTEVITDLVTQTIVVTAPDTQLIETAEQGPAGPPGPMAGNYPGKTLVWAQGVLSEVLLYLDAAKTQLAERRVLNRTGQTLTSIDFFDGAGAQTKTRTLAYSSGVLTGVTEA